MPLDVLSNASLAKLTIEAFKERERTNSLHIIKVPFNPDSISVSYTNNWGNGPKAPDGVPMLTSHNPSSSGFSCKLIFAESDALLRGLSPGYGQFESGNAVMLNLLPGIQSVSRSVERFLTICTGRLGNSSRPAYLTIDWGSVFKQPQAKYEEASAYEVNGSRRPNAYPCQLESVSVNYTLFSRQGDPLRAELDCKFVGDSKEAKGGSGSGDTGTNTKSSSIGQITFG